MSNIAAGLGIGKSNTPGGALLSDAKSLLMSAAPVTVVQVGLEGGGGTIFSFFSGSGGFELEVSSLGRLSSLFALPVEPE